MPNTGIVFSDNPKGGTITESENKNILDPTSNNSIDFFFNRSNDNCFCFAAAISLPDIVEARNDEVLVDEHVIYRQTAKFFSSCNSKLCLKGLGDLQVLQQKQSGHLR